MSMDNDKAIALTAALNRGVDRSIGFETKLKELLDSYKTGNKESLEEIKLLFTELMAALRNNDANLQASNIIGAVTILQKLVEGGYLDHQSMISLPIFEQFKQAYCPNTIIRPIPRQPMRVPTLQASEPNSNNPSLLGSKCLQLQNQGVIKYDGNNSSDLQ